MKIEQIEALVQGLEKTSLTSLEFEAGGATLRVCLARPAAQSSNLRSPERSAQSVGTVSGSDPAIPSALTIDARSTGTLRTRHPLSFSTIVSKGDAVSKDQIVAFLQVGDVLSAVVSPSDGTVVEQVATEGTLVGYGQPIFNLA